MLTCGDCTVPAQIDAIGFRTADLGDPPAMDDNTSKPEDATKPTDEQREMQAELDHQNEDDPNAPGLHQSRNDLADESRR
ncbi:hypothetical protein MKUB_18470 [Mycobacterium kubicae]|uniref:Uncharacterized protein n=2 Tax=Mycobacterium kubicae TaxID=120959 RepID=A0ABQ1BKU0_9MYCO|nr:hypothetical protein AWC13_03040 [Mycobacterium kubicae]GFG64357.1 hypothetical protein MKUB_18470 [Mycobacterium kubicae]